MTEPSRTDTAPRARPVADLPAEALLARAGELARRWAIALILARPPARLGEVPLEDLAREAPAVCAQALRAVQSDSELARLTGRGAAASDEGAAALSVAAICGASDPAALARAVEALRGALWEGLLAQLPDPSARLLADAGDRLAYVCSALLAAALEQARDPAGARAREIPTSAAVQPGPRVGAHAGAQEGAQVFPPPLAPHRAAPSAAAGAIIVDERVPARARAERRASSPGESPAPSSRPWGAGERPLSWDESPPVPPARRTDEIAIRDRRREEGPAAWVGSIGAQLERFEHDGLPFAVLLVELVDLERARAAQGPQEAALRAQELERALTRELGALAGSLTRERPGRCWLLAPETDRAGAELLARRLAAAAASGAHDRGAALAVAIGAAVCPDDGREAAALAAHADLDLYAARWSARTGAGGTPAAVDDSG